MAKGGDKVAITGIVIGTSDLGGGETLLRIQTDAGFETWMHEKFVTVTEAAPDPEPAAEPEAQPSVPDPNAWRMKPPEPVSVAPLQTAPTIPLEPGEPVSESLPLAEQTSEPPAAAAADPVVPAEEPAQ